MAIIDPIIPHPASAVPKRNAIEEAALQMELNRLNAATSSAMGTAAAMSGAMGTATEQQQRIRNLYINIASVSQQVADDLPQSFTSLREWRDGLLTINTVLRDVSLQTGELPLSDLEKNIRLLQSSIASQVDNLNTVGTQLNVQQQTVENLGSPEALANRTNRLEELNSPNPLLPSGAVTSPNNPVIVAERNQLNAEEARYQAALAQVTALTERFGVLQNSIRSMQGVHGDLKTEYTHQLNIIKLHGEAIEHATSLVAKYNQDWQDAIEMNKAKTSEAMGRYQHMVDSLVPGSANLVNRWDEFAMRMNSAVPVWMKMYHVIDIVVSGFIKFGSALAEVVQKLYTFGREYATPLNQVGGAIVTSYEQSIKSIGSEASFSNAQYQETIKATQNVIGGQFAPEKTGEITQKAIEFGVSPDEFVGATYKAYGTMGRSYADAEGSAVRVRSIFDSVGLTGRKAFEFMSSNANLIATYGQKFLGSIGESAARFTKMGIDVGMFRMLATDIVNDFGSFIDKTAELGATIPGMQLDVATLAQKSFMEGPIALGEELQAQLQATGKTFADLPYFQQTALRQTFNLDEATMAKLTGKPLEDIPTQTLDEQKKSNSLLGTISNSIVQFLSRFGGLGSVTTVLEKIFGVVSTIAMLVAAYNIKNTLAKMAVAAGMETVVGGGATAVMTKMGTKGIPIVGGVIAGLGGAYSEANKAYQQGAGTGEIATKGVIGGVGTGGGFMAGALLGAKGGAIAGAWLGGPLGAAIGGLIGSAVVGTAFAYGGHKAASYVNSTWGTSETEKANKKFTDTSPPAVTPVNSMWGTSETEKANKKFTDTSPPLATPTPETPTKSIFDGVIHRRPPPTPVPPMGPGEAFKINEQRNAPSSTTAPTTKPADISQKIDFTPVIVAINSLGAKISAMKMEGDVYLDAHKVGTTQGSVKNNYAFTELKMTGANS